jgi:hypothetical protein
MALARRSIGVSASRQQLHGVGDLALQAALLLERRLALDHELQCAPVPVKDVGDRRGFYVVGGEAEDED